MTSALGFDFRAMLQVSWRVDSVRPTSASRWPWDASSTAIARADTRTGTGHDCDWILIHGVPSTGESHDVEVEGHQEQRADEHDAEKGGAVLECD